MSLFHIAIEPPPTHQAALRILKTRDGRQFIGKMAKSSAKKWSVEATRLMSIARGNSVTFDKPCQVGIVFIYPHTKESRKQADRTGADVITKSTRPDLDNLAKSALDALVDSGWLADDSLIVELVLRKGHGEQAMVIVDITEYQD